MNSDIRVRHFVNVYHQDYLFNKSHSEPLHRSGEMEIDRREAHDKARALSKKLPNTRVELTTVETHKFNMYKSRNTMFVYVGGKPLYKDIQFDALSNYKHPGKTIDNG